MGNRIKKNVKLMDDQTLKLRKGYEHAKCKCPHTSHGELNVVPVNGKGPLHYTCKDCHKDINFTKIPETSEIRDDKVVVGLIDACETVDNAIDTIKITLDLQNDNDKELLERLAELQYRIRNEVPKYYGKALTKNNSNRRKNRSDYNDSSWSKPQMTR